MPDRLVPVLRVVRRRSEVDLDPGLVERETRERHQVLPADEPADPAEVGLDRLEPLAVAETPDEPLVVRRHELPVVDDEPRVRAEDEQRVVERAAGELVGADGEPDALLARDACEPLGGRARHLDRLAREPPEHRLHVGAAGEEANPPVGGVDRDERLREERQPRPGAPGLVRESGDLLDRRLALEDDGLGLDAGDLDRLVHGAPNPPPPGVSIVITSPTDTSTVTFAGSGLPFKRLRPGEPGEPPRAPAGAWARRSAMIETRHGSSASSSRTTPSPTRCRPTPPDTRRI